MENSSVKLVCNSTSSRSSSDEHSRRCKESGRVYYALLAAKTLSIEHRHLQARHCSGYFKSCILISRAPDMNTSYIACACLCTHRRTYSVQCSDKICFPQLRIKCGIAKSCPGTHTALQAPMVLRNLKVHTF